MAESEDPELTFFYRYTKIATTYRKTSYENDMNTSIEDSQLKRKTKRHNKIDRSREMHLVRTHIPWSVSHKWKGYHNCKDLP